MTRRETADVSSKKGKIILREETQITPQQILAPETTGSTSGGN